MPTRTTRSVTVGQERAGAYGSRSAPRCSCVRTRSSKLTLSSCSVEATRLRWSTARSCASLAHRRSLTPRARMAATSANSTFTGSGGTGGAGEVATGSDGVGRAGTRVDRASYLGTPESWDHHTWIGTPDDGNLKRMATQFAGAGSSRTPTRAWTTVTAT